MYSHCLVSKFRKPSVLDVNSHSLRKSPEQIKSIKGTHFATGSMQSLGRFQDPQSHLQLLCRSSIIMKGRTVALFLVFTRSATRSPRRASFLFPATSAAKGSAVSLHLSSGCCHSIKCKTVSLFNVTACHFVTPDNLFKTLRRTDISLHQGT